jgi:hypothetical protein
MPKGSFAGPVEFWRLLWRTALTLMGSLLLIVSITELAAIATGASGNGTRDAPLAAFLFLVGLGMLAGPVSLGIRDALEARRNGER